MKQDSAVERHSPEVRDNLPISGVVFQRPPVVSYEFGNLVELFRTEWSGVFQEGDGFDHLYFIKNPEPGARPDWHKHEHTLDRYMVIEGVLELVLWDGRENSPTTDEQISVTLEAGSPERYSMVRIPPGVWHTLCWVSPAGGILVNAKDPPFAPESPDKYRVPLSHNAPNPTHRF